MNLLKAFIKGIPIKMGDSQLIGKAGGQTFRRVPYIFEDGYSILIEEERIERKWIKVVYYDTIWDTVCSYCGGTGATVLFAGEFICDDCHYCNTCYDDE